MTKQTLKHFAVSSALLGLVLSASLCLAQGRLAARPLGRHLSVSKSATVIQTAQPGGSPSYTYTLFDFPGTFYTFPVALNVKTSGPKSEIVGGYGNAPELGVASYLMHLSENSKGIETEAYQSVNVPAAPEQSAFGVNWAGQIVGEYIDSSGIYHGWELSGGTFTTIDVPFAGATGTGTNGINDSREIAGGWSDSSFATHGFTIIGGTYASFDYPGATNTWAWSLNNKGDITGYYTFADQVLHGFLLSVGTYTSLDPPGSVWTVPTGVDDAGDVVGGYCTTSQCVESLTGVQGFLYSGGTFTTFTIPGATGTALSAINDKGVILGGYYDVAGFEHGFIAVP